MVGCLWRCVGGSGGGVEPLDEEEVDFLLVVEDEVDDVAGVVGSEGPPSDGAGGVVRATGGSSRSAKLLPWAFEREGPGGAANDRAPPHSRIPSPASLGWWAPALCRAEPEGSGYGSRCRDAALTLLLGYVAPDLTNLPMAGGSVCGS
jgi:hypothetical protein